MVRRRAHLLTAVLSLVVLLVASCTEPNPAQTKKFTQHKAVINVEQGEIKSAVMDEKWDMTNQKML